MTDKEVKLAIQSAIKDFSKETLTDKAINLFKALGYNTERQNPFPQKTYNFFKESFLDGNSRFNEGKALVKEWKSIDLLFQLTRDELSDHKSLFGTGKVKWEGEEKETVIETYLFFTIELIKTDYSRSALAQITREINKIFPMPVMLLFKYGELLTLSVINRRLNKKDAQRDVLEKVTLIKDISFKNPHRAHIEIFYDLSLEELKRVYKYTNFAELHNAWQKTLDTKELNKRFYRELSNWYFWAINCVSFPNDIDNDKDDTVFNSESIIRLLTRLIFIWFIKEKNLIPEKIFDGKEVSKLIKGFKTKGSTVYYRAILQNLFFATLNQKIEERAFATDGTFEQNKKNYGIKNLYRYSSDFAISKDEIIKLFERVPFLNGGLFDCLDSEDKNGKVMYLDGFSRNPKKQAQVPDELFFSQEKFIDLSDVYFNKRKKNEKVKGLFNIFNHYKFTVTENTPIEEEVALDPELLGRVFENLLASYNPETKTTARKQTGSFYTPREIVNYMVDESLKAYFKQKLETEAGMKPEDAEVGLEFLLGYNEKEHLFDEEKTSVLINAIDNCKILDPACGSGAFPMGILHKLVHILHKLDPQNKLWKERQIEKAMSIDDPEIRDILIADIETAFNNNELDYGRKLYLIENCIYGVDIQPIATQISKLRFFISLIVDQKADENKVNFGIRPLPNLETKFVAANSLIGIDKPKVGDFVGSIFDNNKVKELEEKIKDIRHRLFSAKTSTTKQKLREEDQKMREEMCNNLENSGWTNESARQLAAWDPYDQNASSPFFDPDWMFGIMKGFDIIIGNPPYLREKGNAVFFKAVNESEFGKMYHQGKMDFWFYFLHKAIDITNNNAFISFITPRYWINSTGASKLIKRIKNHLSFINVVDIGKLSVFNEVAGQHMTALYSKTKDNRISVVKKLLNDIKEDKTIETENLIISYIPNDQFYTDDCQIRFSSDIIEFHNCVALGNLYDVSQGVVEAVDRISKKSIESNNSNKLYQGQGVFVLSKDELKQLNLNSEENKIIKKYLEPTDIGKYQIEFHDNYLIYSDKDVVKRIQKGDYPNIKKHLEKFRMFITSSNKPYGLHRPRQKKYFDSPRIIFKEMFANCEFVLDYKEHYVGMSFSVIIQKDVRYSLEYLLSILNSRLALYWFYKNAKHRGAGVDVGVQKLRMFPVNININEMSSPVIYQYVFVSCKNEITNFLYSLIDAMVYELYFTKEVKTADAEVLRYLTNLPELKDEGSDDKKIEVIEKVYKELSNPNHPVSIAMEKQKNVPEIRIIEGLPALSEVEKEK